MMKRSKTQFVKCPGRSLSYILPIVCIALISNRGNIVFGIPQETQSVVAMDDRYSVIFTIQVDGKFRLDVRDHMNNGTLWQTQPSSNRLRVSFVQNRIIIFKKIDNEGILDMRKPRPIKGATMFALDGKKIGDLPEIIDGIFMGDLFVANYRGGISAFRATNSAQEWDCKNIEADEIAPAGSGLVILRKYDSNKNEFRCAVLSVSTGDKIFQISGPRDDDTKILVADREQCLTLHTKQEKGKKVYWQSELLNKNGEIMQKITWTGMPYKAVFSIDGRKIAAVCVLPAGDKGNNPPRLVATVCDLQGNILKNQPLVDLAPDQAYTDYKANITCESDALTVTLERVFESMITGERKEGEKKPGESSDQEQHKAAVLEVAKKYIVARSTGDVESLEKVLKFQNKEDKESFREFMKRIHAGIESTTAHSNPIHLVILPENPSSGDYLFLVPTREGYLPRKLPISSDDSGFHVEYRQSEFPIEKLAQARIKSVTEESREDLKEKLSNWKSFAGEDLKRAIDSHKKSLAEIIFAIKFAQVNKIDVHSSYDTIEQIEHSLARLEKLTAEQTRDVFVKEIEKLLEKLDRQK